MTEEVERFALELSLLGPQPAIANANKNSKLNPAERAAERLVNDRGSFLPIAMMFMAKGSHNRAGVQKILDRGFGTSRCPRPPVPAAEIPKCCKPSSYFTCGVKQIRYASVPAGYYTEETVDVA